LQWLDAATLDKAVEMKVNFYPAYLKARLRLIGEVDQEKLANWATHDRPRLGKRY
jgi:hypothetical protein